jgi:hypothetical protein
MSVHFWNDIRHWILLPNLGLYFGYLTIDLTISWLCFGACLEIRRGR